MGIAAKTERPVHARIVACSPLSTDAVAYVFTNNSVAAMRSYVFAGGLVHSHPLYLHQAIGITKMISAARAVGYHALLDDCGLGKTIQVLYAVSALQRAQIINKIVIVCKSDLAQNWIEEISKHTPNWKVQVLCGVAGVKNRSWNPRADAYIINYELLGRSERNARYTLRDPWNLRKFDVTQDVANLTRVLTKQRCALIIDESHKIGNTTARVTRVLCALAKLARTRYILTGTLESESVLNAFSQIYFLDGGKLFGKSWRAFMRMYAETRLVWVHSGHPISKVCGFKNLDDYRAKLRTVSTRRTKEQCLDLPEKIVKTRWLTAGKDQYRLLCRIRNTVTEIVSSGHGEYVTILPGSNLSAAIVRLMVAAAMPTVLGEHAASAKLDALAETMQETNEQIIVWCVHRSVCEHVRNKLGNDCVMIYGGMKDTQERINRFKSGAVRTLVATQDSLREGHNLQNAAHAVYFQLSWSLRSWMQSQNRIHRIGQQRCVVIERFALISSLDKYILSLVDSKEHAVRSAQAASGDRSVVLRKDEFLQALAW